MTKEKIDTKQNLCDTCSDHPAECESVQIEFGDGVGNDNVISCGQYNIFVSDMKKDG